MVSSPVSHLAALTETIVAPLTAYGHAPVAWIRLSGPRSWEIARLLAPGLDETMRPWRAQYVQYAHGDDGLLIAFPPERSFTGEHVVEASCHGSQAAVRAWLVAAQTAGARMAEPGEFSQRAFLNGRIDLTQAEGIRMATEARFDRELEHSHQLRQRALSMRVAEIKEHLLAVLAAVEAATDFSEETGELDRVAAEARLSSAASLLAELCAHAVRTRRLHEGIRVAIVGQPNAGKSSLMNALLNLDRSIVTEIPGTTRDTVEEVLDVAGVPVRLIDTAGLRDTHDPVEQMGVTRSRAALSSADEVWYLVASDVGWTGVDERECPSAAVRIATKTDLCAAPPEADFSICAPKGEGLAKLWDRLERLVKPEGDDEVGIPVLDRHAEHFHAAAEHVAHARKTLQHHLPEDLLAVDLQGALRQLGAVTGEAASPDMLQEVFSRFCIGK